MIISESIARECRVPIRCEPMQWVVMGYFLVQPTTALAYLGPGLGMTASVVLTLLMLSILFSVCYLIYVAIRRALGRRPSEPFDKKVRNDL